MKNKKFLDLSNNKVVEVTDQFEDIVILDNRNKIKMNQLLNTRLFEEYIDPNSFFKNDGFINNVANQIRNIPLDDWKNRTPAEEMGFESTIKPTLDEPAILPYDQEVEKEELLKKAQTLYAHNGITDLVRRQQDILKDILEDDEEITNAPIAVNTQVRPQPQQSVQEFIKEETKTETKMDPILEMFKNVKRNTSFRIDFTVENKIPRIDFIEMMEDSYNTSIIEFLAQEFTDEIIRDPEKIKEKIKNKLMDLVYPDAENKSKTND